jgi:hypothetical protein
MNSLFKNKKGQIPVVSDILNAIGSSIQWLTQSAPTPFRIIFFLLLLFIGIGLLSLAVRVVGYHCSSTGVPMKISTFNLYSNIKLITNTPDPTDLNSNLRSVEDSGIFVSTTFAKDCGIKNSNATITDENGTVTDWSNKYAYSIALVKCVTCDHYYTYTKPGNQFLSQSEQGVCTTDSYRIPNADKNVMQKAFCGWYVCEPPINYYWRQSDNRYVCTDLGVCGNYTVGRQWDDDLASAGAVPVYPGGFSQETDVNSVFSFQCDDSLRAQLAVYGIPIFDYRMWVIGILLMVIIGFFAWLMQHK